MIEIIYNVMVSISKMAKLFLVIFSFFPSLIDYILITVPMTQKTKIKDL